MKKRGLFLYNGLNGVVYVSFEQEENSKLTALDSLLPVTLQGKTYEKAVKSQAIAQFFDLADMVLSTADSWSQHVNSLDMTGVTKDNPIKTKLPSFDLDFLNLRTSSGGLHPKKITQILSIVATYWENPKDMAISIGYVAAAWRNEMSARQIIKFIRDNTQPDPKTGELKLVFPNATPEEQLFGALLPADIPISKVTKATLETLVDWISSVPRDHEQYEDQKRRAKDIVFLGVAHSSGKIDKANAHTARDYIWQRIDQPANFQALWRHIQARNGRFPAHDPKADYGIYNERIADFYDDGADNLTFAKAVLELAQSEISVPTKPLCGAAWMLWELDQSGQYRPALETVFNADLQNWMAPDGVMQFMRQIFKDQFYGTGESELDAYLADNGTPGTLRQLKSFFGQREKTKVLREFGVIDAQGQWSEVGFQRQQALAREAHEKDIPPSLEWMRWHLHRRHHTDQPVALAWALMDDHLPEATLYRVRKLASVALSGGMIGDPVKVGQTITSEQYRALRKIGAWISDPLTYDQQDNLWWLGFLARQPGVNWHNWTQICSFVWDKLDQKPDPELLKDWQDGVVTFEGHGRYQNNPAKPFKGAQKVGRNDPCPCGSGKKYKRCCGR